MKVYTCDSFVGHYPVGTAAVIVAAGKEDAKLQLEAALRVQRLAQTVDLSAITELKTSKPTTLVMCNGNY